MSSQPGSPCSELPQGWIDPQVACLRRLGVASTSPPLARVLGLRDSAPDIEMPS